MNCHSVYAKKIKHKGAKMLFFSVISLRVGLYQIRSQKITLWSYIHILRQNFVTVTQEKFDLEK